MLYYDAPNPAPNPRRVRIYMAEKKLSLPTQVLSIPAREHKAPDYLSVNPLGQVPSLALDDGSAITESISICRFLEALHPEPALFGTGAQGIAEVDMWIRRIELRLMIAVGMVWLHTHPLTARVVQPQHKEFGESQRHRAQAVMGEFNGLIGDREWLAGKDYSMADIVLLTTLDFASWIGLEWPDDVPMLRAWHERASARPSASA